MCWRSADSPVVCVASQRPSRWLILSLVVSLARRPRRRVPLSARGQGSRFDRLTMPGRYAETVASPSSQKRRVCRNITAGTTHSHAWTGTHDGA